MFGEFVKYFHTYFLYSLILFRRETREIFEGEVWTRETSLNPPPSNVLLTVPRWWFWCGYLLPVFCVRVSVMFHLMLVHYTFSSVWVTHHLLGNSCPLGWPFVLIVFCLSIILVISHFGFEGGICLLIAPVPVHCFLITFLGKYNQLWATVVPVTIWASAYLEKYF